MGHDAFLLLHPTTLCQSSTRVGTERERGTKKKKGERVEREGGKEKIEKTKERSDRV